MGQSSETPNLIFVTYSNYIVVIYLLLLIIQSLLIQQQLIYHLLILANKQADTYDQLDPIINRLPHKWRSGITSIFRGITVLCLSTSLAGCVTNFTQGNESNNTRSVADLITPCDTIATIEAYQPAMDADQVTPINKAEVPTHEVSITLENAIIYYGKYEENKDVLIPTLNQYFIQDVASFVELTSISNEYAIWKIIPQGRADDYPEGTYFLESPFAEGQILFLNINIANKTIPNAASFVVGTDNNILVTNSQDKIVGYVFYDKDNQTAIYKPATENDGFKKAAENSVIPIDILTMSVEDLGGEFISGAIEYPGEDLWEKDYEKYVEFQIAYTAEMNSMVPKDYIINKRVGNTNYDIYPSKSLGGKLKAVDSGKVIQEDVVSWVNMYETIGFNQNRELCLIDSETKKETVIADQLIGNSNFYELAQMDADELQKLVPNLAVDTWLQIDPSTTLEKQKEIEGIFSSKYHVVGFINPNFDNMNNSLQLAIGYGGYKNLKSGDFIKENSKMHPVTTNTIVIPIYRNGQPILGINVFMKFKPVFVEYLFDQNGQAISHEGFGFSETPRNLIGAPNKNDTWVIIAGEKQDPPNALTYFEVFDEDHETAKINQLSNQLNNQNITVTELTKLLEKFSLIYGTLTGSFSIK